jgi:hypothetical protein
MNTTDAELELFLDEALPAEAMAKLEKALRDDAQLLDRLGRVSAGRDAGLHSLAGIWRSGRMTCPSRQVLGSYLLGILEAEENDFIDFHLQISGCRICEANFADLKSQTSEPLTTQQTRRRKYFQSSAGYLTAAKGAK